ncbi:carbohydrate ABC transporter permease [Acutalibacter muris]|jgi:putative aldouronate transport system permease protein|uniref:carbohydrate ABC transporter permease n=1 Tax=Acutalibacter muris TaxID=1796620 RepID=UPI0026F3E056|nr:carbohydrate ABC transporter permease [Acutalibacter muris]
MNLKIYNSFGDKVFQAINYIILTVVTLTCLLPMLHVLALSLSDSVSATANKVLFIPKGFNLAAYQTMFSNPIFLNSFFVSVFRTVVGTAINLFVTILAAYPLSKENNELRGRKWISLFFITPMMISGGLIPTYLLVNKLGMIDSIWSLIIPGCLPIGNVVLMMNFFRGINKSILEAAYIDGANEFSILTRVVLPLSTASIATITLFQMVAHWNDWFGATIYINDNRKWPLQTLLRQMLKSIDISTFGADTISQLRLLSDRSFRGAMIIFATIPILCVYPFMQKHFVAGITIGSVKE